MRLAGLAGLIALAGAAPAWANEVALPGAVAANPRDLAPDEVLLEIDATGVSQSRADTARVMVTAVSKAETQAQARAANAVLLARLTAAARSAGVAGGDIRPGGSPWSRYGFVGNAAIDAGPSIMAATAEKSETVQIQILLRDPGRFEALRAALEDAGADQVSGPFYTLEDKAAAESAARRQAVSRARSEAEDYARSLGLRVARILRVSERAFPGATGDGVEGMLMAMYGFADTAQGEVETRVTVAVDFALAPAR